MDQERIKYLINGFLAHGLSCEEEKELDNLICLHPNLPRILKQQNGNKEIIDKALQKMESVDTGSSLELALKKIDQLQVRRKRVGRFVVWSLIAGLILISLAVGLYFLMTKH